MYKLSIPILAIAFLCFFNGCESIDTAENINAVLLRVKNDSKVNFNSVDLRFGEEWEHYGAVAAGDASKYHMFNTAYRYGGIKVETGDSVYRMQPTDYVGEEPLDDGNYTYKLDIAGEALRLELVSE